MVSLCAMLLSFSRSPCFFFVFYKALSDEKKQAAAEERRASPSFKSSLIMRLAGGIWRILLFNKGSFHQYNVANKCIST